MGAAFNDLGAVILFVQDIGRSKEFYTGRLGIEVQFEDEHSVGFNFEGIAFIVLQVDRARAQLHDEPTTTPASGATAFLAAFTDDVDGLCAELETRGVAFFQEPTNQAWGMRTAYFKDPDGHIFELAQPLG